MFLKYDCLKRYPSEQKVISHNLSPILILLIKLSIFRTVTFALNHFSWIFILLIKCTFRYLATILKFYFHSLGITGLLSYVWNLNANYSWKLKLLEYPFLIKHYSNIEFLTCWTSSSNTKRSILTLDNCIMLSAVGITLA